MKTIGKGQTPRRKESIYLLLSLSRPTSRSLLNPTHEDLFAILFSSSTSQNSVQLRQISSVARPQNSPPITWLSITGVVHDFDLFTDGKLTTFNSKVSSILSHHDETQVSRSNPTISWWFSTIRRTSQLRKRVLQVLNTLTRGLSISPIIYFLQLFTDCQSR